MLSIGAASGGYYAALANEDYYHDGGEPPGVWAGKGTAAFDLTGQVDKNNFLRLCDGFAPDGTTPLVQNAGKENHRAGWDLTFSAPKSVSVLWSQANEATRREIQAAHFQAVRKSIEYLEKEAGWTRRGKAGAELERCDLIVATFEHGTSRAQDPQLHTHAVVLNIGVRADGTFGTLETRAIYRHKMAAGALYRAELSAQLEQRLTLTTSRTEKNQTFEIDGIPKTLTDEFSKRRQTIEAAMKEHGAAGAARAAHFTLSTREKKQHAAREILFEQWLEVGRAHGFSPEQVRSLAPIRNLELEKAFAVHAAAQTITESQAYFPERELIRRSSELSQGRGVGASEVLEAVGSYLRDEAVSLGSMRGERYYTTPEIIALEEKMLSQAQSLKGREHSTTIPETVSISPALNFEQKKALFAITQEPGSISIVSGMAGTGKTTLLQSARQYWEAQGFEVHGAALAAVAAKELEEGAGIKSATIAKTLLQIDSGNIRLSSQTVLVVDEAGMIGTRQMARLIDETNRSGAKIILVGDEKQLQPIEHGAPFKAIGELIGRSELSEIRRQREEWARDAVRDFASGRAADGLRAYAERGLLTVSDTRSDAMRELVADWKGIRNHDGKAALIIAGTRSDTSLLNRMAQTERQEGGALGEESIWVNGKMFFTNDRVLFTRNSTKYGVNNGDLGTIRSIERGTKHLIVKLDSGARVEVPTRTYEHMDLGYAVTTHKAQGKTVENAFVLTGGSMQDRELSYVQMSRTRGQTHLYTERAEAGDTIAELAHAMNKSRQKELAHTLIQERDQS